MIFQLLEFELSEFIEAGVEISHMSDVSIRMRVANILV